MRWKNAVMIDLVAEWKPQKKMIKKDWENANRRSAGDLTYQLARRSRSISRCMCTTEHGARIALRADQHRGSTDVRRTKKFWDHV